SIVVRSAALALQTDDGALSLTSPRSDAAAPFARSESARRPGAQIANSCVSPKPALAGSLSVSSMRSIPPNSRPFATCSTRTMSVDSEQTSEHFDRIAGPDKIVRTGRLDDDLAPVHQAGYAQPRSRPAFRDAAGHRECLGHAHVSVEEVWPGVPDLTG